MPKIQDSTEFTEVAQDRAAQMLIDSPEIDGTYNDAANTFSFAIVPGSIAESKLTTAVQNKLNGITPGSGGSSFYTQITDAASFDAANTSAAQKSTGQFQYAEMTANVSVSTAKTISGKLKITRLNGARFIKSGTGTLAIEGKPFDYDTATGMTPMFEGFAPGEVTFTGASGDYPQEISTELWSTGNNSFEDRLNRANAAFGTKKVKFICYPRNSSGAADVDENTHVHLAFGVLNGIYDCNIATKTGPGSNDGSVTPRIRFRKNFTMTADQGVVFKESSVNYNAALVHPYDLEALMGHVVFEDLHCQNNGVSQFHDADIESGICTGNAQSGWVKNLHLDKLRSYALQIGGEPDLAGTKYAFGIEVSNIRFTDVATQAFFISNASDINCHDIHFEVRNIQDIGGIKSLIDVEPNRKEAIVRNITFDNIFFNLEIASAIPDQLITCVGLKAGQSDTGPVNVTIRNVRAVAHILGSGKPMALEHVVGATDVTNLIMENVHCIGAQSGVGFLLANCDTVIMNDCSADAGRGDGAKTAVLFKGVVNARVNNVDLICGRDPDVWATCFEEREVESTFRVQGTKIKQAYEGGHSPTPPFWVKHKVRMNGQILTVTKVDPEPPSTGPSGYEADSFPMDPEGYIEVAETIVNPTTFHGFVSTHASYNATTNRIGLTGHNFLESAKVRYVEDRRFAPYMMDIAARGGQYPENGIRITHHNLPAGTPVKFIPDPFVAESVWSKLGLSATATYYAAPHPGTGSVINPAQPNNWIRLYTVQGNAVTNNGTGVVVIDPNNDAAQVGTHRFRFSTSGLTNNKTFFVRNPDANSVQLSETEKGDIVDLPASADFVGGYIAPVLETAFSSAEYTNCRAKDYLLARSGSSAIRSTSDKAEAMIKIDSPASNKTLKFGDVGGTFDDEKGSIVFVWDYTLGEPRDGTTFTFICSSGSGVQFNSGSGYRIYHNGTDSDVNGFIKTTTIGVEMKVKFTNGKWLATITGTRTIGSLTGSPLNTNFASPSMGASATSATFENWEGGKVAGYAIDGNQAPGASRLFYSTSQDFNGSGVPILPQYLDVDFGTTRTIDEIVLYFLETSETSTSIPTTSTPAGAWTLKGYTIQLWTGSAWGAAVATETNNQFAKKVHSFTPTATTKIRINLTSTNGAASGRIVEVEAYKRA